MMVEKLCSLIDSARDHVLLGFYPEAIALYEQGISLIESMFESFIDCLQIIKWDDIKSNLLSECTKVREAQKSLRRFKPLATISVPQNQSAYLSALEANNYEYANLITEENLRHKNYAHDLTFNNYLDLRLPLKKRITYLESFSYITNLSERLIYKIEKCIINSSESSYLGNIVNLNDAEECLYETIVLPLLMPELYIQSQNRGILLYGPSGCGKTMFIKNASMMGGGTFFYVQPNDLMCEKKKQCEKLVELLFDIARFYAPSIICFDHFNWYFKDRFMVELQNAIQKQNSGHFASKYSYTKISIIFITNAPWAINQNFYHLIGKEVYVPLPNDIARRQILENFLGNSPLEADIDWDYLILQSKNVPISYLYRYWCNALINFTQRIENEHKSEGKMCMDDLSQASYILKSGRIFKNDIEKYQKWSLLGDI